MTYGKNKYKIILERTSDEGEGKMKNLMKVFLIIVLGLTVALATTQVFAADEFEAQFEGVVDLSENTTETKNDVENENVNNNVTNTNSNVNNTTTNSNKNSSYNNTNLPKTGVEDAIPVAALIVVFGISAVYAYKKISY